MILRCALCAVWGLCLPAFLGLDLDVGYYLHLVRGQALLLWRREPVERLLKRPDLDPGVRERLAFVQEVRRFAGEEIGLSLSKNYTSFCDIGDGPVSWNLTACPKDRLKPLEWNYPVVGRAPYRGFFDRGRAERERDRLASAGYDTYLRPVSAYSTLGWFSDPILSTMLRYRDEYLAELIVHESTHATLWISGNTAFNESLATFVGETGALLFMTARYGSRSSEVGEMLDRRADEAVFRAFMQDVVGGLEALYRADLPREEKLTRREAVFGEAKTRFAELPLKTEMYSSFPKWQLNNARMAAYRTYHQDLNVFGRVYEAAGRDLKAAVAVFRGCEGAENPAVYLERWVEDEKGP